MTHLIACVAVQPPMIASSSISSPLRGQTVNNVQVQTHEGPLDLMSLAQGHFLLVTLFLPQCVACGQVSQLLNQIMESDLTGQVKVIGVCVAPSGCVQMRDFVTRYRPRYQMTKLLSTLRRVEGRGDLLFGPVVAVPITYLIDQRGRLIEAFRGLFPIQYVIKTIRSDAYSPLTTLEPSIP